MATFSYSALKPDGSVARGEISATDRSDAFRRLGRSGLQPVTLEAKAGGGNGTAPPPKEKKTKARATPAEPKPPSSKTKNGSKPDLQGTEAHAKAGAAAAAPKPDAKPKAKRAKGGGVAAHKPAAPRSPKPKPKKEPVAPPGGPVRLKRNQISLFTEELSDLLGAGLQLEPALRIIESRDELSNLKVVAGLVRQQVRDGSSFADALRRASPSFGELYCSLAAAGEVSGALATILKRQAIYLVKLQDLQNKVVVAMIYPACLFTAVIAVSFLFVSFLMPELVSLLESMGKELPTPAKIMLGASEFLKSFWWVFVLLILGTIAALKKAITIPRYEAQWHSIKLRIPLVGDVISRRSYVQFLETLSNLVGNGLPLLKGLELTRNATLNIEVRARVEEVIDAVAEGASLSRTMRRVGFFPPLLTDMIAVGEQTGDLPTALRRAAERYDKELEKGIQRLTAMMQPVILIILAAVVGPMAYMMIRVILESITGLR